MEIQLKPAIDEDRDFLRKLFYEVRSSEFTPLGLPVPALEQLLAMQDRAQTAGYEAQFPTGQIVRRGTGKPPLRDAAGDNRQSCATPV